MNFTVMSILSVCDTDSLKQTVKCLYTYYMYVKCSKLKLKVIYSITDNTYHALKNRAMC